MNYKAHTPRRYNRLECDRVTDALLVCNRVILHQVLGNYEMNASECSHCNSCIVHIPTMHAEQDSNQA